MDADHADHDDLESQLLGMESIESYLEDLSIRAAHHLGGNVHSSIILRHRGENRRVASSSERSASCDDAENEAGSGPCLTAMDVLHTVLVPDVLAEHSWPEWRRQVLRSGFRSSAAFPATVGDGADVAFNVYSEEFDPWDRELLLHADAYSQQIGQVMALGLEVARLSQASSENIAAVRAAETVNQAVGVLMAQEHIDAGRALQVLTARAQDAQVDIVDVASSILADASGTAGPRPE